MKQSEKKYCQASVGTLDNGKLVRMYVCENDYENPIPKQIEEKKKQLIEKGYNFIN